MLQNVTQTVTADDRYSYNYTSRLYSFGNTSTYITFSLYTHLIAGQEFAIFEQVTLTVILKQVQGSNNYVFCI